MFHILIEKKMPAGELWDSETIRNALRYKLESATRQNISYDLTSRQII